MLKMIEEIDSDDIISATSQRTGSSRRTTSSRRTSGSVRSTTSSAAILARAKAQSLKTKIEFTRKEVDLRRQESDLRCREEDIANALLLLGAEKNYAMAEAEAEVLESAELKENSPIVQGDLHLPTADSTDRTYDFVSEHFQRSNKLEELETKCDQSNEKKSQEKEKSVETDEKPLSEVKSQSEDKKADKEETKTTQPIQSPSEVEQSSESPNQPMKEQLNSISNMLVKKELVKSGLRKFRGNAGEYRSWKCSFQQATKDLDLKSFQEMNLILDSLEGEAKSLVQKIYAIHVDKPDLGLQRIWAYLDGEAWLTRSNRTGFDEESGAVQKNPTKGQHKT